MPVQILTYTSTKIHDCTTFASDMSLEKIKKKKRKRRTSEYNAPAIHRVRSAPSRK